VRNEVVGRDVGGHPGRLGKLCLGEAAADPDDAVDQAVLDDRAQHARPDVSARSDDD
jgi:hypothetical protein